MKFERLSDTTSQIIGTHYQGTILTTYDNLINKFGIPDAGSDKTQAEWALEFEDGTIATIYDWKECIDVAEVTEWYIGGFNLDAVSLVSEIIK